jgi:predicted N-acetyltransferase YhbS
LSAPEWYIPLIGWSDDRALACLDGLIRAAAVGRRTRIAALPLERDAISASGARTTTIFVRKWQRSATRTEVAGVEIRRSQRGDAPLVHAQLETALRRGYQQAEGREPDPEFTRQTVDGLVRASFGRDGISYVAAENGRMIGHASGQLFEEDDFGEGRFAALTDISTGADSGRGIGNVLEDAFVDEALGRGARFVEGTVIPTEPGRTAALLDFVTRRGWQVHRTLLQLG